VLRVDITKTNAGQESILSWFATIV
jgi:hypothetical protein